MDNSICVECFQKKGKLNENFELVLCLDCLKLDKYKYITKTDVKNNYLLTDKEIEDLEQSTVKCRVGYAILFRKLHVIRRACDKYRCTLDSLLNSKKQEKQEKTNVRKAKIADTKRKKYDMNKNKLVSELNRFGLELREDSKLCELFIEGKETDLDYVVKRMCQMKYLYEYCHMNECKEIAYQQRRSKYGDESLHDIAERIALNKYSNGLYPTVYPWLQN